MPSAFHSIFSPSRRFAVYATLVAATAAVPSLAQTPPPGSAKETRVFHLANVATDAEAQRIDSAIRNMVDPQTKIYLVEETHDIVVSAPAEQIEIVGKLVSELDRPKKAYRLIYTIAESENGKRIGVQHFAMVVLVGQRIMLKQGDKIPVATGSYSSGTVQTQFTYLDVGMNFDSTLDQFGAGLRLRSKVEQSSGSESVPMGNVQEPIIRQSTIEGTSVIVPGKPLILGSLDIVGSTRHTDIEVIAEPLP